MLQAIPSCITKIFNSFIIYLVFTYFDMLSLIMYCSRVTWYDNEK